MMNGKLWIGRSLAAFLVAFCGIAQAQVSVLSQPGTVIGSFTANAAPPTDGSHTGLLTVPVGRAARVTDIWLSNRANSYCIVHLDMGDYQPIFDVVIQPRSTQHFAMLNGFGLVAGSTLYVNVQSDGNNGISCLE